MSLRNKKLFAGFVGVTLSIALIAGVGAQTANASALTSAQVSAIISLLQSFGADTATINNVQASLTGGTPAPAAPSGGYTFARNLKQGDTGSDVMNLQKVLNMDAATQVAASGAGSPGNETSSFGSLTKAAVIKFQNKYASEVLTPVGLTAGTGFVGAMTRAKLTSLSGGVVVTPPGTTPATGTGLSVSDPGQPGASLAPASAARLPFTKVKLTAGNDGDVTVNSITVERTGLAVDAVFSGVVLIDENGLQLGDAKTFNSNHQATIGIPFTIKAGTSRVLTIAGNIAALATVSSYAGQVATLTVVSVNTNGAVVSGTLPITGAYQTVNSSLTLGSVTMNSSSFDPNSSASKEIGTTAYKFTGFRMTAGSAEKVRLWSVRWYQSGSAASSDVANIQTYVDGVAYPTTVDSTGKYYTALFPGGILLDKGASTDVWISGDIVGSGASNRTVQFDVFKTTDFYLTGETFGYGITPPTSYTTGTLGTRTSTAFTTSNPWIQSSTVTISAGSATAITKSSAVPAQNIAVNVPSQPLGGFMTDMKGESISVQSLVFQVATSSTFAGGSSMITNVTIVDQNGAVVAGPVDEAVGKTLTFTDTITFPVGQRTYTLKGKVPSSTANGATVYLTTTPSTNWTNVTGLTTGNTITLPATLVTMNTMTVKAASLTVTVASTPASQSIVAGTVGKLFANIQFDTTQSGEDIRFSALKPSLTPGTTLTANELSGCMLRDGSATGPALNASSPVNPLSTQTTTQTAYTFTFDSQLVVPKNTVKTLALTCNVSGNAGAHTFRWGVISDAATITATGQTSGSSLTLGTDLTILNNAGPTMTINTGSLAVSTDASSPSYTVAPANTSSQTVGVIKLLASNEQVDLAKFALSLTNTASSSPNDITLVTIWDGGMQVGSATFTATSTTATTTLSTPVRIPTTEPGKTLTVKVDLADIGNNLAATSSGHLLAVDYLTNSGEATGVDSGIAIPVTGGTSVAGLRIMKSYPTVAGSGAVGSDTYLTPNGVADGKLMRFKVTANSKGPIGIGRFEITLSTTSATVANVNIFGFTDSAYSQPLNFSSGGQFTATPANCWGTTAQTQAAACVIAVYPQTTAGATTTVQVPLSTTYYFEVRGTVVGSGTTYSVTATLGGDAAYPSISSNIIPIYMGPMNVAGLTNMATTVDTGTNNSFLWSPNSTTTSLTTGQDWTNAFGLPGLPSSGITQTRTQ